MDRPSTDQYYLNIAKQVKARGTCPRLQVGAVIVKDNRIIGTGYNGSIRGAPHCVDSECLMEDGHCVKAVHSEVNAIVNCGEPPRYGVLYVTHRPCLRCFVIIYQAGIKRIVYDESYRDIDYQELLGINNNMMPDIVQLSPHDFRPSIIDYGPSATSKDS